MIPELNFSNNFDFQFFVEKPLNKVFTDQYFYNLSSFLGLPILLNYKNNNFATYLAGLIEGDGSIITPGKNIHSYNPYFEIAFHIDDLILAETLGFILGGNLKINTNFCTLIIKKKLSVLRIIYLLNGNMRTPKIEALYRMIEWYDLNYNIKIKFLGLDISPLQNNC